VSHNQERLFVFKQKAKAMAHHYTSIAADQIGVEITKIKSIVPCTPLQEAMVSASVSNQNIKYFLSFKFLLAKDIDIGKLKVAWSEAYNNLDILRTSFLQIKEEMLQIVLQERPLPWMEMRAQNLTDQEEKINRTRIEWIKSNQTQVTKPVSFVLAKGLNNSTLILHIFHGLYDGSSLPLLLDAVRNIYHGVDSTDFGPQFHDSLPFGPLAQYKGNNFWKEHLSYLPAKAPKIIDSDSSPNKTIVSSLLIDNFRGLERIRKKLNVAHQALIQACWSVVLGNYCSGLPILGLVVSGRSIEFDNAEKIIGPLFNTILFQPALEASDTWTTFIKSCQIFNTSVLPFQHDPLRNVLKSIKAQSSSVPDNLFIFHIRSKESNGHDENELWRLDDVESIALYPITFEAELSQRNLSITLVSTQEFANYVILENLLSQFKQALEIIMADPDCKISDTFEIPSIKLRADLSSNIYSSKNDVVHFPWGENTTILRKEIARLANVEEKEVNAHQSVFELGLDSIDVVLLSSRLLKAGIRLPMSSIMRYPSIQQLSKYLESYNTAATHDSAKTLSLGGTSLRSSLFTSGTVDLEAITKVLPATPLQEAMVSRMIATNFNEYYNHDILVLNPGVDMAKLKDAWNTVIDDCDILRTAFAAVDDPLLDISYAQIVFSTEHINSWKSFGSTNNDIGTILTEIGKQALADGIDHPLLRLTEIEAAGQKLLILSLPHALYDGWSIQLLHHDVKKVYWGQIPFRPSNDFALQSMFDYDQAAAAKFWQGYLSDYPPSFFSHVRTKQLDFVHRNEAASRVSIKELRRFCKTQGVTLHCLVQMCWTLVLSAYTKSLDVVFGVVLSGRDTEEVKNSQFPTMNTVAFRSIMHGTYQNMLHYINDGLTNVRQFQHFPLRKIQSLTSGIGQKLFDTLFLFQGRLESGSDVLKDLYHSIGSSSEVDYAVCVEAEVDGKFLIWRTACQSSAMDSQQTKGLIADLDIVLMTAITNPNHEIVKFKENSVQIGPLPAFKPAESQIAAGGSKVGTTSESQNLSITEQHIRRALAKVSNSDENEISLSSSIFHHGLDSISAIKLCSVLKHEGIQLRLSDLLKDPTVAGMAKSVSTPTTDVINPVSATRETPVWTTTQIANIIGIAASDIESVESVNSGQLYFLNTWKASNGGLFYSDFEYYAYGSISKKDVEQAWAEIIKRNPILRTVFISSPEMPSHILQVVLKSIHPRSDQDVAFKSLQQPFHSLVVTEQSTHIWRLDLKIHHALYDGVSLDALIEQLQVQLNGKPIVENSDKILNTIMNEHIQQPDLEATRKFWTIYLDGIGKSKPSLNYSLTPSLSKQRIEMYNSKLISDVSQLVKLSKEIGISLPALLLAAYGILIHTELEEDKREGDIVIGIYLANRYEVAENSKWSTMPTVNIVPLRIGMTSENSISDIGKQIQRDLNSIRQFPNSVVSLSQIKAWAGVTINIIVNIVHLPEASHSDDVDKVQIREFKTQPSGEGGRVVDVEMNSFDIPPELDFEVDDCAYTVSGHTTPDFLISADCSL